MSESKVGAVALVAHPDAPARTVSRVVCSYVWRNPGEWKLIFIVDAPPKSLKLPAPADAQRADGLWQHTCFELFLRDPTDGAYVEFNVSPSGQWAAYQFDGYRSGMRELGLNAPHIFRSDSIARPGTALTSFPAGTPGFALGANLEHAGLWRGVTVRAGISAVIEELDGTRSYWALAHAPGKPDFHHADCFALELPPVAP